MNVIDNIGMVIYKKYGGYELSNRQAYILARLGIFVRCGGYYYTCGYKYGKYLACGQYPHNKRICKQFTFKDFINVSKRSKTSWKVPKSVCL